MKKKKAKAKKTKKTTKAKKKTKKSRKKSKPKKKTKRAIKKKKSLRKKTSRKATKSKKKAVKNKGPRVLAQVEHFFGKISVAAFKLKAPLKVGDVILIKGHKTDFMQKVESIQIEHESVMEAKKGAEVGIKVKHKVRESDKVYLLEVKDLKPRPQVQKPILIQKPMFPMSNFQRPSTVQPSRPVASPKPQSMVRPATPEPTVRPIARPAILQQRPPAPEPPAAKPIPPQVIPKKKSDPYGGTKFLSF